MRNRTIAIPVAEVIEGGTKQQFYADLRQCLDLSRRAANKSLTECLTVDSELFTKGKCPKLYTYPRVATEFPGVAFAAASICRAVEKKYRQERWRIATGQVSVPTVRSFPWPLLKKNTTVTDAGEFLTIRIRLMTGFWILRLAGGSAHRDQVQGIRQAINAGGIGDSKLWVDRRHMAIIGLAVALPETEPNQESRGILSVVSTRDALLVATKERSTVPFVINGDKPRQWTAERIKRQQRLRQDMKSGQSRTSIKPVLNRISQKNRRRLASFTHETAAQIVSHARRRKVAAIHLDLTVKSYLPQFPWSDLKIKLEYKCSDAGIGFVEKTQTLTDPDVSAPHVYFKYSPTTQRIKIGRTSRNDGGRHGSETDSPEELVILAIDNRAKGKLAAREKHYHSLFAGDRVKGEWFAAEPILYWLREVGWLGNAGNLSQIAQVLEV